MAVQWRTLNRFVGLFMLAAGLAYMPSAQAQTSSACPAAAVLPLADTGNGFAVRPFLLDETDLGEHWCLDGTSDNALVTAAYSNTRDYSAPYYAFIGIQLMSSPRAADMGVATYAADTTAGPPLSIGEQNIGGEGLGLRIAHSGSVIYAYRIDRLVVLVSAAGPPDDNAGIDALAQRLAVAQQQRIRSLLTTTPLPAAETHPRIEPDAAAMARAGQRAYSITVIDALPGFPELYPLAINGLGEVVGAAREPESSLEHGAVWTDGATIDPGTLGGLSRAAGINDNGLVVGESWTGLADNDIHAFVWDGQTMRDLGRPGRSSAAVDINSAGQIVGYERDVSGGMHAMLWEGGEGRRLDRFGYGFSRAARINSLGQVALTHYGLGAYGAVESYLWSDGSLTDLGRFEVTGLNTAGQVIGYSGRSLLDTTGLIWQTGMLYDLGGLGGQTRPSSINTRGLVVGSSRTSVGPEHAFVWDAGAMRDLNDYLPSDSGWELTRATSINDAGQIVGFGRLSGGHRAFLLTPASFANAVHT